MCLYALTFVALWVMANATMFSNTAHTYEIDVPQHNLRKLARHPVPPTAALDATDPNLRNYGSNALADTLATAEDPQFGRIRLIAAKTAVGMGYGESNDEQHHSSHRRN